MTSTAKIRDLNGNMLVSPIVKGILEAHDAMEEGGQVTMKNRPQNPPVSKMEEEALKKAFNRLCNYAPRTKYSDELGQMEFGIKLLKSQSQGRETDTTIELQKKCDNLKMKLAMLNEMTEKFVTVDDVYEMLKTLKQKTDKKKVAEIIWEVDEDLDGRLCWAEFRLMYNRNLLDQTGLEPNRMYIIVQFLMYDSNEPYKNMVSKDDTMKMLYARYGTKMNEKLTEIFGADMKDTGKQGGEICFTDFNAALESVALQTFWKTAKGKNVAQHKEGRRAMELFFPLHPPNFSSSVNGSLSDGSLSKSI